MPYMKKTYMSYVVKIRKASSTIPPFQNPKHAFNPRIINR